MESPKRVLLDVDNVLIDFAGPAMEVAERVMKAPAHPEARSDWDLFRHYTAEQQEMFYDLFAEKGWCYNLPLMPGAVEGVQALREAGANVYFVTSPMHNPNWAYERTNALIENFGAKKSHIVFTDAKYLCTGDLFVDDKPAHIKAWQLCHPRGRALLWDQPHNQQAMDMRRVKTWTEVLAWLAHRRLGFHHPI